VNNFQSPTFKKSLANAAFISSRGEVYRLFREGDDPTLGGDFILDEFESNELESNIPFDSNISDAIDGEFENEMESESKIESVTKLDFQSGDNNCVNNYNHRENYDSQVNNLFDRSEQLQIFDPLKQRGESNLEFSYEEREISEMKEINSNSSSSADEYIETIGSLSGVKSGVDSSGRFRVVNSDCESAVAELLAMEVPKPIINVPEHIPPQEITFDEKIKRIRGVTGICGKFQPTITEKIISNVNAVNDNVVKPRIFVSKNQLSSEEVLSYSKTVANGREVSSSVFNCAKSESKEIKLSFRPLRDKTAMDISEFVRGNKIPILDSTPDFCNSTPKTIPFTPNQKSNPSEISNGDAEASRNIVTKNNIDTTSANDNNNAEVNAEVNTDVNSNVNSNDNSNDNVEENVDDNVANNAVENINDNNNSCDKDCGNNFDDDIDDKILPFPTASVVKAVNCVFDCVEVSDDEDKIKFEKLFLRRGLIGYEFPNRIENLIFKASEQIADLGDRFIDFMNAGKRVIGINGCFAGDGCSLVSAFAAIELASRGKRILLIDANRRNPTLSNFLEIGDVAKNEIITLKSNFDFMSIFDKSIPIDSSDIFCNDKRILSGESDSLLLDSGDGLFRFIDDLTFGYDFILFDAGCIADVSFSECVENWKMMRVNGIFLVASKNNFKSVDFNNIAKRLSARQFELLGIMINTGV
jgi:Mrp family chromosome partitioning ATPase